MNQFSSGKCSSVQSHSHMEPLDCCIGITGKVKSWNLFICSSVLHTEVIYVLKQNLFPHSCSQTCDFVFSRRFCGVNEITTAEDVLKARWLFLTNATRFKGAVYYGWRPWYDECWAHDFHSVTARIKMSAVRPHRLYFISHLIFN